MLLDHDVAAATGDGIKLVGWLRASGADVVILAAPSRRTVLAAYIEAGACGWIDEAVSLDDVVCLLSDVVAGRPLGRPVV